MLEMFHELGNLPFHLSDKGVPVKAYSVEWLLELLNWNSLSLD
jgi:hypothetical protein